MFLLLIKDNLKYLKTLGVEEGNLGAHSCIKGVANLVDACCTVSPPIVLICIIAGWFMVGVKDNYIKRESDGDQCVGRFTSGLG